MKKLFGKSKNNIIKRRLFDVEDENFWVEINRPEKENIDQDVEAFQIEIDKLGKLINDSFQ